MQLSSYARKAAATGLAASTLLMAAAGFAPSIASAQVHSEGCLVLSGGIVWMITGGTRRGYTSAEVFQSYGYNFSQVTTASAEDVALPVGPIMIYADGTLVKGPSDPLVYLVTGGQKRPFVSGSVFTGRGYSFANIQSAPYNTFADLPTGSNIDNVTVAHSAGVQVISNGAVWWMDANGRRGFSSAAQFQSYGYMFSHVVAANAADLALPNLGNVPDRPACTGGNPNNPPPSGSVSVSVASDNPASGTVITNATVNHSTQATADMLHMTFGGSGAVTQLVLQKTGVSANTVFNNVYLYNGNTRITDSASVNSSGQITFSSPQGLFNAPATISVRADISLLAGSGQSVGVSFVSGMSGSASIGGSASGNLMSLAAIDNLATAIFSANTALGGNGATTNVNAGSNNYTIWTAPLTTSQRIVWLKGVQFKEVGTANSDALVNYSLYLDGTSIATTSGLTTMNGSNYLVFAPGAPISVNPGSHTLEVHADIVKGSGRTMQFSLQNAADVMLTDSSYNVNVTPNTTNISTAFTSNNAGTLSIQPGSVTVQTDPTFGASTTVPGGSTNVTIGKFNLTAYGEDVQVNNLEVTLVASGGLTNGLNNITLFANGSQVGSTKSLGTSVTVNGQKLNFTLGSSLVIPAGTTANIAVKADTVDAGNNNITSGTLQATLVGNNTNNISNGTGRVSQTLVTVPASGTTSGPTLTIGTGTVTVASNPAYLNQTLNPNTTNVKIGSFVISAGATDGLRVSNLAVGLVTADATHVALTTSTNTGVSPNAPAYTNISNVKVVVNGGAASSPQAAAASFNFSQNFTVAASGSATVDVYADLGNATSNSFIVTLLPSINAVTSNASLTPGSASIGQIIALSSATLATATAGGSTALSALVSSGPGVTAGPAAVFNFTATSGAAAINELKFDVTDAVPTAGGLANTVTQITVNGVSAPVVDLTSVTGTGTITSASNSAAVTGVGTAFLSELKVNDKIKKLDGTAIGTVSAIASNTALTLTGNAAVDVTGLGFLANQGYVAYLTFNSPITVSSANTSGVDVSVVPTYNPVTATGNGGIATNTRVKIGLIYVKSTSGNTPSTVYYSGASAAPATLYSNPMVLVASQPAVNGTATNASTIQKSSGLVVGAGVDVIEFTIAAPSSGSIRVKQIGFTPFWSGTLTNSATDVVQVYDPSNSSTILNNSQANIALTSGTQAAIVLDSDLVVSAGQSRTLRIKMDTTGLSTTGNSIRVDLTGANDGFAASGAAQANKWAWNDFTIATYLNGYSVKNLTVTGPTQVK